MKVVDLKQSIHIHTFQENLKYLNWVLNFISRAGHKSLCSFKDDTQMMCSLFPFVIKITEREIQKTVAASVSIAHEHSL